MRARNMRGQEKIKKQDLTPFQFSSFIIAGKVVEKKRNIWVSEAVPNKQGVS